MSQIRFSIEWLPDPGAGFAFGAERATWAKFAIHIDETCVTNCHAVTDSKEKVDSNFVIGPLSGLAEWVVESWPFLLWELPTPFPKHTDMGASSDWFVPGLRAASAGWPGIDESVRRSRLGQWQHRHTFGHGSSDLALPSLTIVPELRSILIAVESIPADLQPDVSFSHAPIPARAYWCSRDDLVSKLGGFLRDVISRAMGLDTGRDWAAWLKDQWNVQSMRASNVDSRRALMFGEFVEAHWTQLKRELGERIEVLSGILADSPLVGSEQQLNGLLSIAGGLDTQPAKSSANWQEFSAITVGTAPHQQGYEVAQRVREEIGNRDRPISDLTGLLSRFDVVASDASIGTTLRTATIAAPGGGAKIICNQDDPRLAGVAPRRFAIASSLGRLLSDYGRRQGKPFGAGQGAHSRWFETRRANAFAAELLLPKARISQFSHRPTRTEVEDLCEDYGISRTAVDSHIKNRHEITAQA